MATNDVMMLHPHDTSSSSSVLSEDNNNAFPLLHLPVALLPQILGNLSLGEVVLLRPVCQSFNDATAVCLRTKLNDAGAEGVLEQNLRVKERLEWYLDQSKNMNKKLAWNHQKEGASCPGRFHVRAIVSGYPGIKKQYNLMKRLCKTPNLGERFALRCHAMDGSIVNMGFQIATLPLRIQVPVEQYIRELEYQRDNLPHVLAKDKQAMMVKLLESMLLKLSNCRHVYASVPYLPKLENHPFETTLYDTFIAQAKESTKIKTLTLKGIGNNTTPLVSCLTSKDLVFVVTKEQFDGMFDYAFKAIDESIALIKPL